MRRGLLIPLAFVCVGCSRSFYREQADAEVYPIITDREVNSATPIGRTHIAPHPLSRLADPSNPDATPKPPDDPAAAAYMAHPYKFRGAKTWGRFGYSDTIEPVGWECGLGLEPDGVLKLDQDKAVEIALVNSREYQTALEDVYLTALALTLNRFEFDTQWFNRRGLTYTRVGASSLPAESNTLSTTGDIGFGRNLAAGGQLLVDFANSFVWEFTGKSHTVTGNLGFQFIQPLLRNFGRDVRLERLTQAERETLYVVRDFARFRKQFWAGVAVQRGGYLDLLLQVQAVRNARENLKAQEDNYLRTQEQFRGGRRAVVDVDQALQGLLSARQQILDTEIGLQNSLDQFKIQLGLPPRLPVELDDAPLDQFVVTSEELEKLQDDLTAFDIARKQELGNVPPAATIASGYDQLVTFGQRIGELLPQVEADLKEWKAILDRPARRDDDPETKERATEAYRLAVAKPDEIRKKLKELSDAVVIQKNAVTPETREKNWEQLLDSTKQLVNVLDDVVLVQNQARIYRLVLPPISAEENSAIAYAKQNRLDFQNQTARVTDAWRRVIVAANALQSDLTVTTAANLVTDPLARNPFDFSNDASRFSVGLAFDGPLNRQAERNQYRAALIDYQRERRDYMALSDTIEQQVRFNLRSLRQTRVSFEIARQRLIAAARQVANERFLAYAPPAVQQRGGGGDATLRTLQALAQLNQARNDLAGRFIQYEQQRVQLLLNLEELQLDARGFPTNALPNDEPDPAGGRTTGPADSVPAVPPPPSQNPIDRP